MKDGMWAQAHCACAHIPSFIRGVAAPSDRFDRVDRGASHPSSAEWLRPPTGSTGSAGEHPILHQRSGCALPGIYCVVLDNARSALSNTTQYIRRAPQARASNEGENLAHSKE